MFLKFSDKEGVMGMDYKKIFASITRSQAALMREYADITIRIPESEKWDYAIPENYTNFQDGFLVPNYEAYRGAPLFDHPQYGRLYLRWEIPYYAQGEDEAEKYLCFDRRGGKYTVIIQRMVHMENGNPSYFRFLPKVREYSSKRKIRKDART